MSKVHLRAGERITICGDRWIVLDPEFQAKEGTGVLAVLDHPLGYKISFSAKGDSNYTKSHISLIMDTESQYLLERGAKPLSYNLNLSGNIDEQRPECFTEIHGAFLLNFDLYDKYRDIMISSGFFDNLTNAKVFYWLSNSIDLKDERYSDRVMVLDYKGRVLNCRTNKLDGLLHMAYIFDPTIADLELYVKISEEDIYKELVSLATSATGEYFSPMHTKFLEYKSFSELFLNCRNYEDFTTYMRKYIIKKQEEEIAINDEIEIFDKGSSTSKLGVILYINKEDNTFTVLYGNGKTDIIKRDTTPWKKTHRSYPELSDILHKIGQGAE